MFRSFTSWLFDGQIDSILPMKDEILKYNSPITHQFILSCFMQVPEFNHYLDRELNNFDLYKIDKMELLHFVKQCVIKLRLSYNRHYTWRKSKYVQMSKLHNALSKRFSLLKKYEISSLCEMVDKLPDEERKSLYAVFGIDEPKKVTLKRRTQKKGKTLKSKEEHNNVSKSVSLSNFLKNFHLIEVK